MACFLRNDANCNDAYQSLFSSSPNEAALKPSVSTASVAAFRFNEGVILLADKTASFGSHLRFKNISRFQKISDRTLLACDGDLSDAQFLSKVLREEYVEDWCRKDGFRLKTSHYASILARTQYVRRCKFDPLLQTCIIAGYDDNQPYIGYTDIFGTNFEDRYASTGLGEYYAISLLRSEHRDDLTLDESICLAGKIARIFYAFDSLSTSKYEIAIITSEGIVIKDLPGVQLEWNYGSWSASAPRYGLVGTPTDN